MNRKFVTAALVLAPLLCQGQGYDLKFAHEVSVSSTFDNREFARTELAPSVTFFGIRPHVALGVSSSYGKIRHEFLGGVDPLYDFGGDWTIQPLLYYRLTTPIGRLGTEKFQILAGAFSRANSKAFYSLAFFSSSYKYKDDTYEGLQLSWTGPRHYYEVGVDWKGQLSSRHPSRREQFIIYSGGHHDFLGGFVRAAYSAQVQHYACSYDRSANNVVDNILINPYVDFNLGYLVGFQKLLLRAGYIQALERDRAMGSGFLAPARGEILALARKWNVTVQNDFFFGGSLMALYDSMSPEGTPYATDLYMADAFMRNYPGQTFGLFDLASVFWEPQISRKLKLCFRWNVYFCGNATGLLSYAGSHQVISIKYTL